MIRDEDQVIDPAEVHQVRPHGEGLVAVQSHDDPRRAGIDKSHKCCGCDTPVDEDGIGPVQMRANPLLHLLGEVGAVVQSRLDELALLLRQRFVEQIEVAHGRLWQLGVPLADLGDEVGVAAGDEQDPLRAVGG